MSPTTTEIKLEEELDIYRQEVKHVRCEIQSLQEDLQKLKSKMVKYKLLYDEKQEELRRFRLMFPDICKPPTR